MCDPQVLNRITQNAYKLNVSFDDYSFISLCASSFNTIFGLLRIFRICERNENNV